MYGAFYQTGYMVQPYYMKYVVEQLSNEVYLLFRWSYTFDKIFTVQTKLGNNENHLPVPAPHSYSDDV